MHLEDYCKICGGNKEISHETQRPVHWSINPGLKPTTKVSKITYTITPKIQKQADNPGTESAAEYFSV